MKTSNCLFCLLVVAVLGNAQETADYGTDVSFPIHHAQIKDGPIGDRSKIYKHYMDGCRKLYDGTKKAGSCDEGEEGRIAMNLRQAQSVVVRLLIYPCNQLSQRIANRPPILCFRTIRLLVS